MAEDPYVIIEWVHNESPFPRYTVATPKHAEELELNVRRLETCASLELAARIAAHLNAADPNGRSGTVPTLARTAS